MERGGKKGNVNNFLRTPWERGKESPCWEGGRRKKKLKLTAGRGKRDKIFLEKKRKTQRGRGGKSRS